jgi:hypothetical protein
LGRTGALLLFLSKKEVEEEEDREFVFERRDFICKRFYSFANYSIIK